MSFKAFYTKLKIKFLKPFIVITISFKVIVFDQFTKGAAITLFSHHKSDFMINEFLNFILVYNKGISFGVFSEFHYSNYLFAVLNIIICSALLRWLYQNSLYSNCFAVGFIIGGALGNLIDRIRFSAVVDFIDFHLNLWHYPTFNFADSAVVIGVIMLLVLPAMSKIRFDSK
jgi:signal peptidase II